ncbi:MAG: AAA family ATPase [Bdellovibrionales bacterium]|nr:AAA family ATPase [Bdellovibrionales bacterium]
MKNIKLKIKGVRCFAEEQHFNIRPLTFLVGENSTGKTTVMGCFNIIMNSISHIFSHVPDFNREPYLMGSFQDIANKKLKGNSKTFEIGCEFELSQTKKNKKEPVVQKLEYKFHFTNKKNRSGPFIQKVKISLDDFIYSINSQKDLMIKKEGKKLIKLINRKKDINDEGIFNIFIKSPFSFLDFITRKSSDLSKSKKEIILENLEIIRHFERELWIDTISLAPIRSKPKRTYDPIRVNPDSEGSEIPMTLMNLSNKTGDWKTIRDKLVQFGQSSGLFSNIEVKKYGSVNEPFQLQFKVRGFQSNIMDIGYGVSQILPLLVRLFYPKNSRLGSSPFQFLLQQPEVHLHPKAQAELTSLFVESTKQDNSFLIETHSDHIINRASIEIRKKNISPDDVSLIYLEPTEKGVKAHNISFDKQGNLKGVPKGYRDFFLEESDRYLGFKD